MIKKLCDFCGKSDLEGHVPFIADIQWQKQSGLEYILGIKKRMEVCASCFDDFVKLKRDS